MEDLKSHFSLTFDRPDAPLHFAAHSHHPWPDVSFEAHAQAWRDAAAHLDLKWELAAAPQEERAKAHVARILNLSSSSSVVFGQNTHEFVTRLISCFDSAKPVRVLTTSSEFHSFQRQIDRLSEVGLVDVTTISCSPFSTFVERFLEAAQRSFDLIYVSQVFFDSGLVFEGLESLADTVPSDDTMIVVDGYHSFMAMPVDLGAIENRCFYIAGGYKYAMAGEGVCFMHCPPDQALTPVNTVGTPPLGICRTVHPPVCHTHQMRKGSKGPPTTHRVSIDSMRFKIGSSN